MRGGVHVADSYGRVSLSRPNGNAADGLCVINRDGLKLTHALLPGVTKAWPMNGKLPSSYTIYLL